MSKKLKILITGATGFIGERLIPEISEDYDLSCLVREQSGSKTNKLKNSKVKIVLGDLLKKQDLLDALEIKIDLVIHLATSHASGKENSNFIGSKNLIEACKERGVKKIIFLSSMAVKRKVLDEYGGTKLEIESLIKKSGLKYTILRPSIIYSENNLSLVGKSLKSIPFFIPVIGNGKYKLDLIYIKDVVKSIRLCLENSKTINKTYDIAGGEKLSFNQIVRICKKQFNIKKTIIKIPIWLCLIIFKFYPIVSIGATKGIYEDTNAEISSMKKDLKIVPVKFSEGIKNVNL